MISQIELGDPVVAGEDRPAVVVKKAGAASLWDIAKASGSTVEAIRAANGLQQEPDPEQILLIPII